jgi:hypothetical protein
MDLNHGPPRYKLGALPTELQAENQSILYAKSKKRNPCIPLYEYLVQSLYDE